MVAEHITDLPSNKHSGIRPITQMLVIHSAETPLANGYAVSVTNNWLNRPDVEASINAFAGPDTLVRAVHTDYAAWHASWANTLSVGYEMTGYAAFNRDQWLTQAGIDMIDRLAREMAEDARLYDIPLVYLSNDQVNQIRNGNRGIRGIATHAQVDPANRTDPGVGFPYDYLLDRIYAYSGGTAPPPTPAPEPAPVRKTYPLDQIHWTVEPGDTITKIANYYGVPERVQEIIDYNGVNPNALAVGDRIWIPGRLEWLIEAPDTIRSIAAYYGLDPTYLANLNGLPSPDSTIYIGNSLLIKP